MSQALIQKGYTIETIKQVLQELDFQQDESLEAALLQRDLEKVYNKNKKLQRTTACHENHRSPYEKRL